MAEKREYTQGVTPKGKLYWAHVYEPEKFEGKDIGFSVNMKFGTKETNAFIAKIDEELEKAKHNLKLKPGQRWSSEPFMPYREDKDGDTVFKFKSASSYQTKDGVVHDRKIPVFDAHGKPVKDQLSIGNDTVARVAYTIVPYYISKAVNGIKLRLDAIQIIDLKEYGEKSASGYGFEQEEGFDSTANDDPFTSDEEDTEDGEF